MQDHQDDANALIQLATAGSFRGVTWERLAELTDTITTPQDLYHAADSALLLAKRSGRNRVAVNPLP